MWWWVAAALAQDAVTLKVVKTGQIGSSKPGLQVDLHLEASRLDIQFVCGGKMVEHHGPAALGATVSLAIDVPAGQHTCTGTLSGAFTDGSEGTVPLSFSVQMFAPLVVKLEPGSLDLDGHRLVLVLDRKASKVELTISGLGSVTK